MRSLSQRERQPRLCHLDGPSFTIENLSFSGADALFAQTFLEPSAGKGFFPAILSVRTLEELSPEVSPACRAQGFVVRIEEKGLELSYESRTGLISGLLFLQDCLGDSEETPLVHAGLYIDWPDFPVRGWFLECGFGTDWMTLDDWKLQIRRMARLRLNLLGIGLYGCWCARYDGVPEFLMTPIPVYEKLNSPIMIRAADGHILREGRPELFVGNFLAEVVAEAVEHGLEVMPVVNLLGHNTLIPRVLPEVSSKTTDGKPKGYGFCTAEPATRDLVSGWLRDLAEKHFPIQHRNVFCIGMDEMMELSGIDPDDLDRIIDPWCECPKCRPRAKSERLVEWVVFLVKLLTDLGFQKISIYHDECQKQEAFSQLFSALDRFGLKDRLIVIYWNYSADPQPLPHGGESWIMPTTGLFGHMAPSVKLRNIEKSIQQGARHEFSGVVSYTLVDDGFDRAERYFSALAWERARFSSREDFTAAYCSRLAYPERAQSGFASWDALWDCEFPAQVIEQLFYYYHAYWCWRMDYPAEILNLLSCEGGFGSRSMSATALRHLLERAAALTEEAAADFSQSGLLDPENGFALQFDLDRTRLILSLFRKDVPRDDVLKEIKVLSQQVERRKPRYLVPYYQRELSYIHDKFSSLKGKGPRA